MDTIGIKYKELTNHKKVFDRTYWGNFTVSFMNYEEVSQMARNRDMFVETHGIKMGWRPTQTFDRKWKLNFYKKPNTDPIDKRYYDHREWYRTKDGYVILVISPYAVDEKLHETIIGDMSYGTPFIKTDNLYSNTATTYYKKIR